MPFFRERAATYFESYNYGAEVMGKSLLSVVFGALMASVSSGAIPVGPPGPDDVHLIYDPGSGNFSIASQKAITTFELTSSAGNLTGSAIGLGGLFDVNTESKLFKLDPAGFGSPSYDFGPAMKPGLSLSTFAADFTVDGSFAVGGQIRGYIIPEPANAALIALAAIGLLGIRRK
ncbi:MAG: hypothetical protein KDB27_13480 [Planctomycetales bacterium]|nr:hypothetical protein [Planctomycetales bacterium]